MSGGSRILRRPVPPIPGDYPADLHPVLARLYAARQVESGAALDLGLARLHGPETLAGLDAALDLLEVALRDGRHILVIGDFDADGATSTAVALRALRAMGAARVDFLVPDRFRFGYGLSPEIVAVAAERRPDLIMTVDNGIASHAGVREARRLGIPVLVTDHHLPGDTLPAADAIVNPNQGDCPFPSKALAGVGVVFYLMMALRGRLRSSGWFRQSGREEPNLASLLDLVALGTVADVVPLDRTNRILVSQGIARIRRGQCCAGISALLETAGRKRGRLSAVDLGYTVAPRINAAGRLEDIGLGIRCLLTDDLREALQLAEELEQLNQERRSIEKDMRDQAEAELQRMRLEEEPLPLGLCLYRPDWHEGVVGILASRIKDQVHRPVVVFTDAMESGLVKGSARSVSGVHVRDVLAALDARHPGLMTRFGGHAMAAGVTLPREHLDAFQDAFDQEVRRFLAPEQIRGTWYTDGALESHELTLALAECLADAGPWGAGFPEPLFDGVFDLANFRIVGERHLRLDLRHPGQRGILEAIAFNTSPPPALSGARQVELVYHAGINEYRGERRLQLVVEHLQALPA